MNWLLCARNWRLRFLCLLESDNNKNLICLGEIRGLFPFILLSILLISCESNSKIDLAFDKEGFIQVKQPFGIHRKPLPLFYSPTSSSGIVFELKNNTNIYSLTDGNIVSICSDCRRGKGNHITIEHGDGSIISYYHLSEVFLNRGMRISQGQEIGISGSSGCISWNGLGISVKKDGELVDPEDYFSY